MIDRVRPHITYANVVATLALFIALAGSSYAALRIGSRQIVNNSVRSADIRNGGVHTEDVRNRSLTERDVERDSLGGRVIDESKLGTVPDALLLGGQLRSTLLVGCDEPLQPAAGVCVEPTARPAASFGTASSQCNLAGGRLPLLVEIDAAAPDTPVAEWTADILAESGGEPFALLRGGGGVSTDSTSTGTHPYRCALPQTNK